MRSIRTAPPGSAAPPSGTGGRGRAPTASWRMGGATPARSKQVWSNVGLVVTAMGSLDVVLEVDEIQVVPGGESLERREDASTDPYARLRLRCA